MSSDLTILLTLKGRTSYTYRWLEYMNNKDCPYHIIISDGGEIDKALETHLMDKTNYPNLEYDYIRYPYDEDYSFYYKKLYDSVCRINTRYMFLADNDDFLLLDNMKKNLEFLEANPDYSSCGGRPIYLDNVKNAVKSLDDLLVGDHICFRDGPLGGNNEAENRGERVLYSIQNYYGYIWYNIQRTEAVKKGFYNFVANDYKQLSFVEFSFAAALAECGKIRCDCFSFYVRQSETSMLSGGTRREEYNLLMTMLRPFWSDNVCKAVAFISEVGGKPADDEYQWAIKEAFCRVYLDYKIIRLIPPRYKQIANRIGVDRTLVWRGARYAYLWLRRRIEAVLRYRKTQRLLKEQPELQSVVLFMNTYDGGIVTNA